MVKKSVKASSSVKLTEQVVPSPAVINEVQNFSEITISIESFQHIQPAFPSSNVFAKCEYFDTELGETEKTLLTDDPMNIINHHFKLRWNTESSEKINELISNPVLLTIMQTPHEQNSDISSNNIIKEEELLATKSESSIESVISLYEALTGDIVETTDIETSKTPKKSKDKTKDKKKKTSKDKLSKSSSKESKKSKSSLDKNNKKSVKKEQNGQSEVIQKGEVLVGYCIVDLLPLVLGKTSFTEFVPIILAESFCDDRMIRYRFKPGLVVTASIDKPVDFICKPKIFHVTFESIYNIPSIMNEELEYQLCMLIPADDSGKMPLLVKNGNYTTTPVKLEQYKYWPEMPKSFFNRTHYKFDQSVNPIKNFVENVNLDETFSKEKPRIEFNSIKRNVLSKDVFLALADQIRKHQKVILEIYASKNPSGLRESNSEKLKDKGSKEKEQESQNNYLHLMAVLDLSSLMYPGVSKVRIAVPLTTFHQEEALVSGGLEQSYFLPPKPKIPDVITPEVLKGDKKKDKKEKKAESNKSSKSSKSPKGKKDKKQKDKGKQNEEKNLDMQDALPTEPVPEPPPEPSKKVFNENGERTFIVVEIELTEPLIEKQDSDDLHQNLEKMLHAKPTEPEVIVDYKVIQEYCQDILKSVIARVNEEYFTYSDAEKLCHCKEKADFLTYLRRIGVYHNFVYAMIQVAILLSQNQLYKIDDSKGQEQYKKLIEEIFIHLNSEINQILNKSTLVDQRTITFAISSAKTILFYAKEATEMGNFALAERYYLEILYQDYRNPDFWYEYAVYKLEREENEKAFMCLQEALKVKMFHTRSLLLNGIILTERNQIKDAEVCLLSLLVQEPHSVEGWVVLYLFYKRLNNIGGMDLAKEMALKYLDDPRSHNLIEEEDLAWFADICPNTIYFKTAVMLIKMRQFSWAEDVLSYELKEYGVVHYLLAVICYYRQNYKHSLEHLEKSVYFHGMDLSVASLMGHCQVALGNFNEAVRNYKYILESYKKPPYKHLIYVNCAKVINDTQESRKLFLIACKHSPTPYTWMSCGSTYYKLNDLLSAEECFSEATALDSLLPESWGYLTLINLKMGRINEAEVCYNIALKNNLRDDILLNEIKYLFDKIAQK